MHTYHQPLLPGEIYHLFNRAIGNENLFLKSENYKYFLKKYDEHMSEISNTYCYCLLPNHFHFMIRINKKDSILDQFKISKKQLPVSLKDSCLADFIMERFSNFLNGYTKAFNKMYERRGALFLDYTKRSIVVDNLSFKDVVHYVHKNPVHHGFRKNIEDWPYSSYKSMLSNKPTKLLRSEVLETFGSKELFIEFHKQPIDLKSTKRFDAFD